MKKKTTQMYSMLLASTLGVSSVLPASLMPVAAQAVRVSADKTYAADEMVNINKGAGAIDASSDVAAFCKLTDFTFNVTFTMSGSSVNSLFFLGDSTKQNHYITVYVNGHTIGVESRDAAGNQQISAATVTMNEVDFSKPHKLTFTMAGKNYYRIYLDGKKIKEGSVGVNFSAGLFENANYMGFGNGKRAGGANSYPFTGSLGHIELYGRALSEEDILDYHRGELGKAVYTRNNIYGETVNDTAGAQVVKELTQGSVSVRYRINDPSDGPMMLAAVSDTTQASSYLGLYINPSTNQLGFDAPNNALFAGKVLNLSRYGKTIADTRWHTLTVTKADGALRFYLDGAYLDQYTSGITSGFFSTVKNADSLGIGYVPRKTGNTMALDGAIDHIGIYANVLNESEIAWEHETTAWQPDMTPDMSNAYKSDPIDLYYSGYQNVSAYRIPSLLTTQAGTQLAFIDERNSGAGDAGNIDTVVRRRPAGSEQFSDPITLIDLPNNGNSAAFMIDASAVQDQETGRIFMLVDMFPESLGLMDTSQLTNGTGYKEVDGEMCQILYANDQTHEEVGVIREVDENGIGHVYDDEGNATGYTVIVNAGGASQEKGNLYKDGEYKGNIYMLKDGPDKGELVVLNTTYLWLVYSDDDGQTWSDPIDITPQVKEDWMVFLGTGPGVGIQLHNGNLVFPVYSANINVGSSQSSAVIISEDHGKSWKLGESPQKNLGNDRETMSAGGMLTESQAVQLNDGRVLLFMRNTYAKKVYVASSTDGGMTWDHVERIDDLNEYYCQLSVIHYNKDDGEYLLLSNPNVSGRYNGWLHLGKVMDDGTIHWEHAQQINEGKYQYSCLSVLENDGENPRFGLMYEDDSDGTFDIKYMEFDENFVKAPLIVEEMPAPRIVDTETEINGTQITISLHFDQNIMAVGMPKLEMTLGNEHFQADYTSGSGSDVLTFSGALPEGIKGIVRAKGISLEQGKLENLVNKTVESVDRTLYDLTRITEGLAVHDYSSQQSASTAPDTDGAAVNVLDGNERTYWHSVWSDPSYQLPQYVTIDLGKTQDIYKVGYVGRQGNVNGRFAEYAVSVSTDGERFTEVQRGTFQNTDKAQYAEFLPVAARYVRLSAYSAYGTGGTQSCSMAEMMVYAYADGVIEQGDLTALQALMASVQEMNKDMYSAVTWEAVQTAWEAAQAFIDAEGPASQVMIDNMKDRLQQAVDALIDIRRIQDKLNEAAELPQEAYTETSWAALQNVLAAVREQMKQITSSREVTDVVMRIESAIQALVEKPHEPASEAAIQALRDTVEAALAMDADDENLRIAIHAAQTILDKGRPSADEVTDAHLTLREAMQAVAITTAKADVQETITFIHHHILNDVTDKDPALVEALQETVAAAQMLLQKEDVTVAALQAANEMMLQVAQKVCIDATKTKLNAKIAKAEVYLAGNYTDASLTALQKALADAKEIAQTADATIAQMTEVMQALDNAIEGLQLQAVVDRSALAKELDRVSRMLEELDAYIPSTVEGLAAIFHEAEEIFHDADAIQKDVDAAAERLHEAAEKAKRKVDKSELQELINYVNTLDLSDYTPQSAALVRECLDKLKEALQDESITEEAMRELADQMQAAIAGLVLETLQDEEPDDDTKIPVTGIATQTGLFAGMFALAAGAIGKVKRKKKSE